MERKGRPDVYAPLWRSGSLPWRYSISYGFSETFPPSSG